MRSSVGFSILRQVRRLATASLITVLSATLLLRLDAAVFEYRVLAVLRQMVEFKLGKTSRSELVNGVTGMRSAPYAPVPNSAECLIKTESNLPNWSHFRFPKVYEVYWDNKAIFETTHWLGVRICDFRAESEIQDQSIKGLDYRLILDNGSNQYPGAILINVDSVDSYPYARVDNAAENESPEYSVRRYSKWPELDLRVSFTPLAPATLTRHAFEPSLNCLWRFDGCRTSKQILPAAWQDEENIQRAASARLHSSNPCPDRILSHRVRDASNILLLEVEGVGPEIGDEFWKGRFVDYKLLRVLKGELNRPLKAFGHSSLVYDPGDPRQKMPNPSLQLLRPGTRVLMFSDSQVDEACEIVAATDSALQTIQSGLPSALVLPR
jgi:hypothetical protein